MLGVDGGATKTDAVVMDVDGRILGSGRGGSSNWESVGLADAVNAIVLAVDGALAEAGHTRRDVVASVFALAGVDWPADHVRLAGALDFLGLGGERYVTNDAFAALRAGISGRAGCVSSAGTGAVAAGATRRGRPLVRWPRASASSAAPATSSSARSGPAPACARLGPGTALADALCAALGVPDLDTLSRASSAGAGGRRRARPARARGGGARRRGGAAAARGAGAVAGRRGLASRAGSGCSTTPFELVIIGSVHLTDRWRWTRRSPRAWQRARRGADH